MEETSRTGNEIMKRDTKDENFKCNIAGPGTNPGYQAEADEEMRNNLA